MSLGQKGTKLADEIVVWFEQAREVLALGVRELGFPTATTEQVTHVDWQERSYSIWPAPQRQSVFRSPVASTIYAKLPTDILPKCPNTVKACISTFGAGCHYWSPPRQITPLAGVSCDKPLSFDQNPELWTWTFVFVPALLGYCCELDDLDTPDLAAALTAAQEVVEMMHTRCVRILDEVAIGGLKCLNKVEVDGVSIEPMNGRQMGEWVNANPFDRPKGSNFEHTPIPHHRLTVISESNAGVEPEFTRPSARLILAALQIVGYNPYSSGTSVRSNVPAFTSSTTSYPPIGMPRAESGDPKFIDEEDLKRAIVIAESMDEAVLVSPRSSRDVVIHRFHIGLARPECVDQLLDFTIGLEALLLPGSSQGELSYRFRVNGALWIGEEFERDVIFQQLDYVYKLRSNIVHGGQFPDSSRIEKAASDAKCLLQRAIEKAITSTWPTSEDFARLTLQ